uniref:E3 ubiquitin-protein ligase n=1 Tax=Bursaphelenchus xylophilus TaxID=6326 RepID=A0A1I7SAZ3_BURXY
MQQFYLKPPPPSVNGRLSPSEMDDTDSPGSTPTHRITVGHVYDFASELTTTAYDELKELIGKDEARQYLLKRNADDYNAPKFSTHDLRSILRENTELKQKLSQFERPESSSGESGTETATETASVARESVADFSDLEDPKGDDEVVYGPINKEPEEKLYPWKYQRKSSGIAKLFSKLFSPSAAR